MYIFGTLNLSFITTDMIRKHLPCSEKKKNWGTHSNDEIYYSYTTDEVASAWQIALFSNNENTVILLWEYPNGMHGGDYEFVVVQKWQIVWGEFDVYYRGRSARDQSRYKAHQSERITKTMARRFAI